MQDISQILFATLAVNQNMPYYGVIILLIIYVWNNYRGLNFYKKYYRNWRTSSMITIIGAIESKKYNTSYNFPTEFHAIIWKIQKMKLNIKRTKILNMNKNYRTKGDICVPGVVRNLKIADDVYMSTSIFSNDRGDANTTTEYSIEIFSYKKKSFELQEFIKNLKSEYEKYIKYKLEGKHKFFSMKRVKNDSGYKLAPLEIDFKSNKRFDNIFFEGKDELIDDIDFFLENKEYYESKGIPYTLGIMLYGEPGCGKSSTIKAIANYTKRHVLDINLSKIKTCTELMDIFLNEKLGNNILPIEKRIIVMEDIDCMLDLVKDRSCYDNDYSLIPMFDNVCDISKNDKSSNKSNDKLNDKSNDKLDSDFLTDFDKKYDKFYEEPLNLSFLLNLIDGIVEQSGRILIITTNYPARLDKALIRPGRIDLKVEFKKCSKEVTAQIVEHFLDFKVDDIVDEFPQYHYSASELIGICKSCKDPRAIVEKIVNKC